MDLQRTYRFPGGFPDDESVADAYERADFMRAVLCYRHFFAAVSGLAIWSGTLAVGIVPNRVFGTMDTRPGQLGLTLNSDTPYAPIQLDLARGPLVVEIPPGPIVGAGLNVDQSWVADLGVVGPDAGHGGRHLFTPPGWSGDAPDGVFVHPTLGNRVVVGLRAIPQHGDVDGAIALLRSVRVTPLDDDPEWREPEFIDLTGRPQDTTPQRVQGTLEFWRLVHEYVDTEPVHPGDAAYVAELATLGIRAGEPFEPDERMQRILTAAAVEGDAQLRVQSLADRRPDRVVWPDRRWEWVTLRPENGVFELDGLLDVDARQTWFYQAIASSPAMFRRHAGAGSLYWFVARDADGAYLDGGRSYRLEVPLPVPAALFWSMTVYDATTRSQIATAQDNAALRSLFELAGRLDGDAVELGFGPERPDGVDAWVQTLPERGWFAYFRIYGPQDAAFDGSWRPGDVRPA